MLMGISVVWYVARGRRSVPQSVSAWILLIFHQLPSQSAPVLARPPVPPFTGLS
jgi:hypothetical protein